MNGSVKKILFGIVWLWLFWMAFWLSLDGDRWARLIESQGPALGGTLTVSGLETQAFGIIAKSVEFQRYGRAYPVELETGPIQISIAPWNLLLGRIGFEAQVYQGSLEGYLSVWGPEVVYQVQGVSPNHHKGLRKMGLIQSNPRLDGKGRHDLLSGDGRSQWSLAGLKLSGETKNTGLIFELPQVTLSQIVLEVELSGPEVKLAAKTLGDLAAQIDGKVGLNRVNPMASRLDLKLTGTLEPSFESRLGMVAPLISGYRDPSGRLGLSISGPARMPQVSKL